MITYVTPSERSIARTDLARERALLFPKHILRADGELFVRARAGIVSYRNSRAISSK